METFDFDSAMQDLYPDTEDRAMRHTITVGGGSVHGTLGGRVTDQLLQLQNAGELPGIRYVHALPSGHMGRTYAGMLAGTAALDLLTDTDEIAELQHHLRENNALQVFRGLLLPGPATGISNVLYEINKGMQFKLENVSRMTPEQLLAAVVAKAKARIDQRKEREKKSASAK